MAAFAAASGIPMKQASNADAGIDASLQASAPEEHEALFRDADFRYVELYYAAFTIRGWIVYG